MSNQSANHCCSFISALIALILAAVALGGSKGNNVAWTYSKIRTDVPGYDNCVYDFSWGLYEFKVKAIDCGDFDFETTERYGSDECKEALVVGDKNGDSVCDKCRSSGTSIQSLQSIACVVGIATLIFVLLRWCDKAPDGCKRVFATFGMTVVSVLLIINIATWAGDCHAEISNYIDDIDNVPPRTGTDTNHIWVGMYLTIIAAMFSVTGTFTECCAESEDPPAVKPTDLEMERPKAEEAKQENNKVII
eukprot:CAMPEP_0170199038 /NCGR_PEP_ID=MMETSP0040_2-20121228/69119_1 /TAXON_ID=641309 /ORGANISM="Lotharella oceanica, Strain CCMP622" /LENGTH=248 /DNA_ID=CAMNT_0010449119 /DNA_START=104 /DNA_END=850 /DNA_ORIENTATION=+